MEEKKSVLLFVTKGDFFSAMQKGKYDSVNPEALKNINLCQNLDDVIGIKVKTGSLHVLDAFKIDEKKFSELNR